MLKRLDDKELMVRFLLGDVTDEEREFLEDRYLADDEFFEELLIAEDELIDSYVYGELTQSQREQFERCFLTSPERRERVAFAMTMKQALADRRAATLVPTPRRTPVPFWAQSRAVWLPIAATLVIGIFAGMWLIVENARLRERVEIAQAEQMKAAQAAQQAAQQAAEQSSQNEQLAAELADQQQRIERLTREQQSPRPAPPAVQPMSEIASLSLTYRMTRSSGSLASLVLKPETKTALFRLALERNEYSSYRAEVRTLEGQTVYSRDGLRARNTDSGPTLILRVPANRLTAGDHTVMVIGVTADGGAEEVAEYYFRVLTPPSK
ncbi:MAG TPA: hypothetical protein VNO70_10550 [Blastocatellia bacterium]|nr:hypothetical protein [Blastocatellia bacterium]